MSLSRSWLLVMVVVMVMVMVTVTVTVMIHFHDHHDKQMTSPTRVMFDKMSIMSEKGAVGISVYNYVDLYC